MYVSLIKSQYRGIDWNMMCLCKCRDDIDKNNPNHVEFRIHHFPMDTRALDRTSTNLYVPQVGRRKGLEFETKAYDLETQVSQMPTWGMSQDPVSGFRRYKEIRSALPVVLQIGRAEYQLRVRPGAILFFTVIFFLTR
jgi:hypothetical protein